MEKKKSFLFSLDSFKVLNFSFHTSDSNIRKDRIDFRIQHRFGPELEKNLFHVGFKIKVVAGRKSNKELASIETLTSYILKKVEPIELKSFPEEALITFISIAYSNTRGALAAKAQGTIAGEVPLPLINPQEVIQRMKGANDKKATTTPQTKKGK